MKSGCGIEWLAKNAATTLSKTAAASAINTYVREAEPFLFVSDFNAEQNLVIPLEQINPEEILYEVNGRGNSTEKPNSDKPFTLTKEPISYHTFRESFDWVQQQLHIGNSYLVNLTFPTAIVCSHSLREIFYISKARYKLWLKDHFVVFSPEIFVRIEGDKISSFPMKGTIDAAIPNAESSILNSAKEMAEHVSIVDLIRNDMSIYAEEVEVERFRYVDEVQTHEKKLLQVSSQISGRLPEKDKLGDVLFSLLPAGSISGAPKAKTLEIIAEVENYERAYYTGVFGVFDGQNFDSGVMIRYIEEQNGQMTFKSGGGIHALSEPKSEYREMLDKVYVPVY